MHFRNSLFKISTRRALCFLPFVAIFTMIFHHITLNCTRCQTKSFTSYNKPNTIKFLQQLPSTMEQTHFEEVILNSLMPEFENHLYPDRVTIFKHIMFYLTKARHNNSLWRQLDLMQLPAYNFDPNFRNPCWWADTAPSASCFTWADGRKDVPRIKNQTGETRVLQCLPYFYIIGQGKCGSTDLFNKILEHPEAAKHQKKESMWLYLNRYLDRNCSSIESFVDAFQTSANFIWQRHEAGIVNPYVTGDGSVGYISHSAYWDLLPGNEGCEEPCFTNADLIHHITPHAKLILSMRNPTERLYSHYFQRNIRIDMVSAEHFHILVVRDIELFQECLDSYSLRTCCYEYRYTSGEFDLVGGIYYIFLADWLKVFPREQFHLIIFEEYATNRTEELKRLYIFLNLRALSEVELLKLNKSDPANQRRQKARDVGDMWNSTRKLLEAFYKPFNERLSVLLNNDKYNW